MTKWSDGRASAQSVSEFGKVTTIYRIRDPISPVLILSHAPDDLTKLLTLSSRLLCAVNLKRAASL